MAGTMNCLIYNIIICCIEIRSNLGLVYNSFQFTFPLEIRNAGIAYPSFTLASVTVAADSECIMRCYVTPKCVAINIGSEDSQGHRLCEMKMLLVILEKWMKPRSGFSYFHIGECQFNDPT